jgi:DNA-binding response OmpR family regulator
MTQPRILLVDDDVSLARTLALYLEENGNCLVRVEHVGSHALAAAREFAPHVIILDIVMPDADGASVAAAIGADPVLHATPIVFLTALVSTRETGGRVQEIGGHPFLAKPVDPDTMLAYISKYVRD